MDENKTFEFHWLTGEVETHRGRTPAEALTLAGYSQGALPALDYWKEVDQQPKPQ